MDIVASHLLSRGTITPADLEQARDAAARLGGQASIALIRLGALSEKDLFDAVQELFGFEPAGPDILPNAETMLSSIEAIGTTISWCKTNEVVPWIVKSGDSETLMLGSRNPLHPQVQEIAEQWKGGRAELRLVSQQYMEALFSQVSGADDDRLADLRALSSTEARLREMAEEAPVIDFVNAMFSDAVERRASDIHLEPREARFIVRMRIDGILVEWRAAPRSLFDAVASRIKLLSGMDIAERRLPQDGRQTIRISGREVDLRVSSLPTTWGESIVLRLLGKSRTLPSLEELGFSEDQSQQARELCQNTNGILLVTGPTGSGKSTTIYRLLSLLHDGERKILTVEDPVEFDLPGVMQTQARPDIGLTFAAGLRSMLRQDPDIIMVGEIRDSETASIAVQAALTGHLVISTLHTNSAIGAAARLLDLGVEPFLLSDVLRGVIGQRLVRRLCDCAVQATQASAPGNVYAGDIHKTGMPAGGQAVHRSLGCARCSQTGFRGRLGLYEILAVNGSIAGAIRERAPEAAILELAASTRFRPLREDGLQKAALGLTTLDEVFRVTGE